MKSPVMLPSSLLRTAIHRVDPTSPNRMEIMTPIYCSHLIAPRLCQEEDQRPYISCSTVIGTRHLVMFHLFMWWSSNKWEEYQISQTEPWDPFGYFSTGCVLKKLPVTPQPSNGSRLFRVSCPKNLSRNMWVALNQRW
ncbi:unnamed protein product [Microthlaspi erraticum]|uniref:Uncharacterized protein n=1 Tax=Microthlaspi erraticum TaxID=1685480 RepID=A0A6D2L1F6_9BRAS|nr:unnamed protein product [Microthlaspi erraticum]